MEELELIFQQKKYNCKICSSNWTECRKIGGGKQRRYGTNRNKIGRL